jgi:recombination protein RecA
MKNKTPTKQEVNPNKNLALQSAIAQIEKNFGKGSIMKLGEGNLSKDIEVTPTGSLALDLALGIGGIPKGRIVEIYGPESSGKTTLVQHIIAECQKMGGTAALIDAEHAFDPVYAEKTGVDVTNLLVSQPDTGEQALEIAETLIRSNAIDIIAIDSVAALTPRAEIEGEMGDSFVALQARLMSQALRKITGAISKSNCTVIFTNQLRMKVGVMFGNPETTPGGNALKFYASVRMEIRKAETIKDGDDVKGIRAKVKVVKNKVAPPFRTAEFDIMFSQGISREGNVLDIATDMNLIKKSGSWYEYNGQKIAQGRDSAKEYLKENPKVTDSLYAEIKKLVLSGKESIPLEIAVEEETDDSEGIEE